MKKSILITAIGLSLAVIVWFSSMFLSTGFSEECCDAFSPNVATIGTQGNGSSEKASADTEEKVKSEIVNYTESENALIKGNTKIEINNATADDLMMIDGIGPVLADNIIMYRNSNGKFKSMSELLNVDGIGKSKLENIEAHAYIDGEEITEANNDEEIYSAVTMQPVSEEEQTETAEAFIDEPLMLDSWEESMLSAENEQENEDYDYKVRYPLDLNSATKEQLMTIKGIGEKTAARIVLYAQAYGFYSVEDLMEVSGIGKSAYEQIRPFVYADTSGLPGKSQTTAGTTVTTTATTKHVPKLPIELNNATIEDLMWIDGIGQTLAIRIIAYGQQNGFYKVDDLLKVNGIGNSKFNAIKAYLSVDTSGLPEQTTVTTETTTVPTEASTETTTTTKDEVIVKLDLNTCTVEELKALGIMDDELADEIIAFRDDLGCYANIEELMLLKRMTRSIYSTIILYVYV